MGLQANMGATSLTRPWKDIAAAVSNEQNPEKMTQLIAELNQVLDEQGIDGRPKVKSDSKPSSK